MLLEDIISGRGQQPARMRCKKNYVKPQPAWIPDVDMPARAQDPRDDPSAPNTARITHDYASMADELESVAFDGVPVEEEVPDEEVEDSGPSRQLDLLEAAVLEGAAPHAAWPPALPTIHVKNGTLWWMIGTAMSLRFQPKDDIEYKRYDDEHVIATMDRVYEMNPRFFGHIVRTLRKHDAQHGTNLEHKWRDVTRVW